SIGFGKVSLPPQVMETAAFWLVPPVSTLNLVREWGRDPSEGLYGIGNVITEVVPLYAMCDPRDVGAVVDSLNTGSPTLFVYDRYPGGVGFAERAYRTLEDVLGACLELVKACKCEDGCPSCVGAPVPPFAQNDPDLSPKGRIPDKEAALIILHDLLEKGPYIPKPVERPRALAAGAGWPGPLGPAALPGGAGGQSECAAWAVQGSQGRARWFGTAAGWTGGRASGCEGEGNGGEDDASGADETLPLAARRLPESVEARLRRQLARLERR
ncbi:MAG: DUF1998 domain-containing protein, partial [Bacillota bacterium]